MFVVQINKYGKENAKVETLSRKEIGLSQKAIIIF